MNGQQLGLTLIELMVTLAVAIILLAIGIPAFQGMEANNRAVALANGIVSAVTLARTEAMARGVPVAVCPNKSAEGVAPECGGTGDWVNGWIVFADPSGSGTVPAVADTIRTFSRPRGIPKVDTATTMLRFGTEGYQRPRAGSPAVISMLVYQTNSTAGQKRCVTVNVVGAPRTVRKDTCP
jgi:type IV fimbrial biogenesis protein FimT